MVDFKNAKIYQIVDNKTGKRYVGSTCEPTLAKRLAKHRQNYRTWVNKDRPTGTGSYYMTSFEILEGGNETIELIEKCDVSSRDELRAREGYWIRELDCVNKVMAGQTMDEWRQLPEVKERQKKYDKERGQLPEVKERKNARRRERYATDEEYRKGVIAAQSTPESHARNNARIRERRATDAEWREKQNAKHRAPEYRERKNELRREKYATDEEYREKQKAAVRHRLEAKRCLAIQATAAGVETPKINQDPLIEQKREWKQELIRCQTCCATITKGAYSRHKKTKYCIEAAAAKAAQYDSDL
jgi:hypothetical protein